jgi:hypothetical protein
MTDNKTALQALALINDCMQQIQNVKYAIHTPAENGIPP